MLNKSFPSSQWFHQLFGFEESIQNVKKYLSVSTNNSGLLELVSSHNNRRFLPGNLEIANTKSLLASITNHLNRNPETKLKHGTFNIIHGLDSDTNLNMMQYVDVMACCSHSQFNGCTVQVASNFNCLEFVNENQKKSDGVTDYALNGTQGPSASLSCASSLVYRNYFYENSHFSNSTNHSNRHINDKEINLLIKTPLTVKHGKVLIQTRSEVERLKSSQFNWSDKTNYYVGHHRNCEVCLERDLKRPDHFSMFHNKKQFVNQVFCSAFNFSENVIFNSFTTTIAQHIMNSMYESTILAAILNHLEHPELPGSNKCFLTLLGGGVFGNPREIIAPAIVRTLELISKSGLDVNIMLYSDDIFANYLPLLEDSMRRTGGKVIIVGQS